MWTNLKYFVPSAILILLAFAGAFWFAPAAGAVTVLTTNSSDTLTTFRTNVNTSLQNLASDRIGTSSTPTQGQLTYWTGATSTGSVATSSLSGSGSITVTGSGYVIGSSVTISCATCATFGYPFPSNATTTLLTFSGGLVSVGSTTINGNATTTATHYAEVASSTQLRGANLADCDTAATSKLLWDFTTGQFSCGTDQTGSTFSYPFPSNATTTLIAFNGGLSSASTTLTGPFVFTNATGTNATSTNISISNRVDFDLLTSAILQTDGTGLVAEYAGTSCTNQFVRSLSALGVATCATVGAADVSLANLTATDSTLTFSGTYTGATARTIGLNLGNANLWTALQTFNSGLIANAASSTVVGNFNIASTTGGVLYDTSAPGYFTKTFSYASSTQGQGTTTYSIGVATQALTVKNVQCDFSNFMRVLLHDGTNRANDFIASSTIGTVPYTVNNSFTAGEKMNIDLGTTTNIAARVYGSCTLKYVYD